MEKSGIRQTNISGLFENIIDELAASTLNFWHKIPGMSPNILTLLSILSSILCIVYLYQRNTWAVLFYVLAMYFDWIDGQYARKYDMQTENGDKLDHYSDIIFGFSLFSVLFTQYQFDLKEYIYIGIVLFFSLVHVGCVENECKECPENGIVRKVNGKLCNNLTRPIARVLDNAFGTAFIGYLLYIKTSTGN